MLGECVDRKRMDEGVVQYISKTGREGSGDYRWENYMLGFVSCDLLVALIDQYQTIVIQADLTDVAFPNVYVRQYSYGLSQGVIRV